MDITPFDKATVIASVEFLSFYIVCHIFLEVFEKLVYIESSTCIENFVYQVVIRIAVFSCKLKN